MLLWALNLPADWDLLGVYLRAADERLLAEAGGVDDPEAVRAEIAAEDRKRERFNWQHGEGLMTDNAFRAAAARIDARKARLEGALERAEGVEEARDTLQINIEALLTTPVKSTGTDPSARPGPRSR